MRGEPDPIALHNAVLEDLSGRPRSTPAAGTALRTSASSSAEALPAADSPAPTQMRGRGIGVSGGLAFVLWVLFKYSVKLGVALFKVALWPFVEITRGVQRFDRWGNPVD